ATIGLLLVLAVPACPQQPSSVAGLPEDWTHHHAVFGDAGTAEQAARNGTYDHWLRTGSDPRYPLPRAQRSAPAAAPINNPDTNLKTDNETNADDASATVDSDARSDSDALLYVPQGLTKATGGAQIGTDGDTMHRSEDRKRFRGPWQPRRRHHDGQQLDWSETMGSGGSLGLGHYPAKFSFSTSTASCSDWVVYGTGLPGSATQATILAYTNLYTTTCSSAPTIGWAINTGAGSSVLSSPVLSLDGAQIVFVQNGSAGATLVILKWSAGGTLTAPTTLANQASGSAYRTCAAPCMFSIAFSGGATDSGSSAWYDYGLDTVWVGD